MKKTQVDKYKILGIICLLLTLPIIYGMISSVPAYLQSINTVEYLSGAVVYLGGAIMVIFFAYTFVKTVILSKKLDKIDWILTLVLAIIFIFISIVIIRSVF